MKDDENIIGNVVGEKLQEVIKKQKYPSSRAFYNIGGSSLGVWLFTSIGAGMAESFMGKESYIAHNCDAWLKLSALILAIAVAFVGAEFLKLKSKYDRVVSFFTGLLIFFCATSLNSYSTHFFKTSQNTEVKRTEMGMIPFRNPAWFPPEVLVKEIETKEEENKILQEDSQKIVELVNEKLQTSPTPKMMPTGSNPKSVPENDLPESPNKELLNNLASYKSAVEKNLQNADKTDSSKSMIERQKAITAELQGFNALIDQDFNAAADSFKEAYSAWSIYHNVDEINKLFQSYQSEYAKADAEKRKAIWGNIYCEISLKYQWGMNSETRNRFRQSFQSKGFSCQQNVKKGD